MIFQWNCLQSETKKMQQILKAADSDDIPMKILKGTFSGDDEPPGHQQTVEGLNDKLSCWWKQNRSISWHNDVLEDFLPSYDKDGIIVELLISFSLMVKIVEAILSTFWNGTFLHFSSTALKFRRGFIEVFIIQVKTIDALLSTFWKRKLSPPSSNPILPYVFC